MAVETAVATVVVTEGVMEEGMVVMM